MLLCTLLLCYLLSFTLLDYTCFRWLVTPHSFTLKLCSVKCIVHCIRYYFTGPYIIVCFLCEHYSIIPYYIVFSALHPIVLFCTLSYCPRLYSTLSFCFSPTRPSGPSRSSSRDVCLFLSFFVTLFLCFFVWCPLLM